MVLYLADALAGLGCEVQYFSSQPPYEQRFQEILERLRLRQPPNGIATDTEGARLVDATGKVIANASPAGFTPSQLRSAYKITGTGKSTTLIAVIGAYDYATAEADLAHLAQTCVDAVQATLDEVSAEVEEMERAGAPRRAIFGRIWEAAQDDPLPENFELMPRATIPYMDEPWYC